MLTNNVHILYFSFKQITNINIIVHLTISISMKTQQTDILIIGGGATGTGIARDLALRGVNSILVEKHDINAGASGGNHGLLHSGARYVAKDIESARACKKEADILKRMAPHCIEDTGGLFVAVEGDDEKFIADFPQFCQKSGIPCQEMSIDDARAQEPVLSKHLIAAYQVEDASIDPFRLSLENISQAQDLGSTYLQHTSVKEFVVESNSIKTIIALNHITGEEIKIEASQIINAAGAWAGEVAALAGCHINMLYSKGTLLITQDRLSTKVINRLRPAGDADILVPGGTVSILGTTSIRIDQLDDIRPTVQEVDSIIQEGALMVPMLEDVRYTRAFSGVRPLVGSDSGSGDRSVSREFSLIDHTKDKIDNFITITGGKLTTYRQMAEKTADMVCLRLGINEACSTHLVPLPAAHACQWTEPGGGPKTWLKEHAPDDQLLCECEMIPQSAIDEIANDIKKQHEVPDLISIGLRSRVGKGTCQGSFCSPRIVGYLYDRELIDGNKGIISQKEFLKERWKGQRAIYWGDQLAQSELSEAIHCGLFSLDLQNPETT